MKSTRTPNMMGKVLHRVFKLVVKQLNNSLSNLGESGSELSHIITEPRSLVEVTKLPEYEKRGWLKESLKDIKF